MRGVDAIVAQLASVSQEQSEGLNQINLALNEMDKVTQNIAAGAEESAAAAEQLSAQSTELSASATQLSTLIGVRAASERTGALKGLIQSPPRRAAPEPREGRCGKKKLRAPASPAVWGHRAQRWRDPKVLSS